MTAPVTALRRRGHAPLLHRGAVAAGVIGALGMAAFYTAVVWEASGWYSHLTEQVRTDWYLLVLIVAGFAIQVAFFAELRHLHRMHQVERAAGGAGAGAFMVFGLAVNAVAVTMADPRLRSAREMGESCAA